MFKTFPQVTVISTLLVFLSACSPESNPLNSDTTISTPRSLTASLESANPHLSVESLDGVWIAVTESKEYYSWGNGSSSEKEATNHTILELYAVKSDSDSNSLEISACSAEPGKSSNPAYRYNLDESGSAFYIDTNGLIEDLESPALAVIESNQKITLSGYSTYYEEVYPDSRSQEHGTHASTLIKISDTYNPNLGHIEINGQYSDINCFRYTAGNLETEISNSSGRQMSSISTEKFDFHSEDEQSSIARARLPSDKDFSNGGYHVLSNWPELLSIRADDESYSSDLTIYQQNPLEFSGNFSAISANPAQTNNSDINMSFIIKFN